MSQFDLNTPVGDWVSHHPQTSRVFESLQIDYCCGGNKSLEHACWEKQLDPQHVFTELEEAIQTSGESAGRDWLSEPLVELCDHIEATHHSYLRRELPRLTEMIDKVVNAHSESHPQLAQLGTVFAGLRAELEPHMFKEEQVLFPAIRQLEESSGSPSFPFGTVANPIRMMEHEHDAAGEALSNIRVLTDDYAVPDDACNTYRVMLDGLKQLETDMHEHVHKENSILFPRAIKLEESRPHG